MIDLTPRLLMAARRCEGSKRVVDVGCDHGHLSIYIMLKMGVESVIAADIRQGPLENACRNIEKHSLQGKIKPELRDGLQGFEPSRCDTVVICGMGGDVMCNILEGAKWCMAGGHKLILQPMTQTEKVRKYLHDNGCGVVFEGLAKEDRKLYCVLEARGKEPVMGEAQSYIFTDKMRADPLFKEFLATKISKYSKIAKGKKSALQPCSLEENILEMLNKHQREAL